MTKKTLQFIVMICAIALLFCCFCSDKQDDPDGPADDGKGDSTDDKNKESDKPSASSDESSTGSDANQQCSSTNANEVGVGKACTKGGKECASLKMICIADAPGAVTDPLQMCTKMCQQDADCGTGAKCCKPHEKSPFVCFLNGCAGHYCK